MSPNLRRGLAAAVALLTMAILTVWALFGRMWVHSLALFHELAGLAVGPEADAGIGPTSRDMEGALTFYMIMGGALILAGGCAAAVLFLRSATGFGKRVIIYLVLLATILPASLYNYSHAEGDFALRAKYQVILNLVLIFTGVTICLAFKDWKVEAPDARVLKIMVFVLVLFSAVLTPGFLTFLWFLWRVNLLTMAQSQSVTLDGIGAVAGVASVGIAFLQYRLEHAAASPQPSPVGNADAVRKGSQRKKQK